MWRRAADAIQGSLCARWWLHATAIALCVVASAHARADDEVARAEESRVLTEWLTQAGLDGLLAAALEEDTRQSPTTNPAAMARLSEAYERMLATASDEEKLADLRERVLRFLGRGQHADEIDLRLAMARAEYRLALKEIDKVRAGDRGSEAGARAWALLARARDPLGHFVTRLRGLIDEDRRLATGADDAQRQESAVRVDQHEQQLLEVRFLRNWCDYWNLWLTRKGGPCPAAKPALRDAMLQDALTQWAEILETGLPFPEPGDTSVDLRAEEYYAHSILGMALTKALTGSFALASGWFDLLDTDEVWSGLREHAAWRYGALIDAEDYEAAQKALMDPSCTLRATDAVGGGIRAAVQSKDAPGAMALAQSALEYAAARGELHAVRLAAVAIPSLAEGDSFTAHLCRGIEAYEQGRSAGDAVRARPFLVTATRELSAAAATAEPGSRVLGALAELLAWSQLGSLQHCDAADSFEAAAASRAGVRADEALWMALRSADLGACPSKEHHGELRRTELARRYLREYPEGLHADAALAVLARAPDAYRDGALVDSIVRLMGGDSHSVALREEAATLLYKRFRGATGEARRNEALRLLGITRLPAAKWPAGGMDLVVRQQLEAALDPAVRDLDTARALLAEVATRYPRLQEPSDLRSELAVRRLSLAIEAREVVEAMQALDDVRSLGDPTWRPIGEALFVAGVQRMDAEGSIPEGGGANLARALTAARRCLRDAAQRGGDAARADGATIALGRALLNEARARRAGPGAADEPSREVATALDTEALNLAKEVLAHRPDDASAISLTADAAMALGQFDDAFAALARLVGGLPERSDEWFMRKADMCELLARTDPVEARRVLEQHAVLVPEWGPGLGGARLKALAQRLAVGRGIQGSSP